MQLYKVVCLHVTDTGVQMHSTDYEPLSLDTAFSLVRDLTEDALEDGTDQRYTIMPHIAPTGPAG